MSVTTWAPYDTDSEALFDTYERLSPYHLHRSFLRFLPKESGAACLDVGAGSGRDASWLAAKGFAVTAVEPSSGLRSLAKSRHASPNVLWVNDALPFLPQLVGKENRYSFVLLSAVWMHIEPTQRTRALKRLAELTAIGGYIAITVRGGPVPDGRLMYESSVDEISALAVSCGLSVVLINRRRLKDSLGRSDVSWQKIVLQKSGGS